MKPVMSLRLVSWVEDVDFRKSEMLNYDQLREDLDPRVLRIGARDEAVLFISKTRTRGAFVWAPRGVVSDDRFFCVKFWCPRGFAWEMLQNYAREAGIELRGMRSFEQHFRRRIAEKVTARVLEQLQ